MNTLHQRQVHITVEMARMIVALCADENGPVAMARKRRREFTLSDSADYFLDPNKLMVNNYLYRVYNRTQIFQRIYRDRTMYRLTMI